MKRIILIITIAFSSFNLAFGQDETSALAYEYFSQGEYEKAVELYKELAKDESHLLKVH